MLEKQFHFLSKEDSLRVINSINYIKHKVIILLMLDAGLRISEACSIKWKNFDFKSRTITIVSLKKRDKKTLRSIPLSNRLYQAISEYLNTYKINLESDAFVFPSNSELGHISRKTIWTTLNNLSKKINVQNLHPHTFRHTFATHHLSAGSSLAEIKTMLGHADYNTTLIYAEIPTEELRNRVDAVTDAPLAWYIRFFMWFVPKNKPRLINIDFQNNYFTIGRNEEINFLNNNISKNINTIVIGSIGAGKSHLLKQITTDKKILKIDDCENIKKTLVQILLHLFKEKETVLAVLWQGFTDDEVIKKIQRENTIQLCDTIIASVKPYEYCILIDDITGVTPTAKKVIERFKDAFVIIAAAREIKTQNTSFLWNFEKLQLENLNRKYAFQFINQIASGLQVQNKELLYNHIFDQSAGNPRAITEMIDRYKKEPFLDTETIREIRHTGALKEIDMTWLIVFSLGFITSLRFLSREMGEPALKFIGSIAMVLLFLVRPILGKFKRKFI